MEIYKILKSEREKRKLSIDQLSEEVEIPVYILEKLENDENYATKDPYGKLYAKKVLKFFNIDIPQEEKQIVLEESPKINLKILNPIVKILPHTFTLIILTLFIYANANFFSKSADITVNQKSEKLESSSNPVDQDQKIIDSITLVSEGDVWITISVDGEKSIINLKEGESKTIHFNNKIVFETIGSADKLKIIYDGKEVKISGREIVHNVFVDSEGIFYNGYNVLRGVPKI
ncbi:helix-turn-helix domain-containing protein [Sulfurihydrogenibium subterraneum]|uniref:helix-turn-helix domain-containing protein n=1 Tax=Sulfurihydrogenibium subterraneum TaxID=171121 RepID=UPI00048FE6D7|nr:helix-turn-helix domain-containing protein [Sulfurihydrogenibium subterraneum]